jgi:hypothetical protein
LSPKARPTGHPVDHHAQPGDGVARAVHAAIVRPVCSDHPYGATIEANQGSVSVPVLVASNNFVDGQRVALFTVYPPMTR